MSQNRKRPLVSAVIIFLNEERFLAEAVDSVLAQTYPEFELFLVDDGSTDRSTEIARRYARENPGKIHYLEHDGHANRGMSASRNLGISRAHGKYVAFLDADDIWLPEKLENQVEIMDSHPEAGMTYGRTLIWYGWTGREDDRSRDYFYPLGFERDTMIYPCDQTVLLLRNRTQTPTTCSAFMRKEAIDSVGGFENAFRTLFEDYAFFLKFSLRHPVYVSVDCRARYRQHDTACCATAEKQKSVRHAWIQLLTWFRTYIETSNIDVPEIRHIIDDEIRKARFPGLLKAKKSFRKTVSRWIARMRSVRKKIVSAGNRSSP